MKAKPSQPLKTKKKKKKGEKRKAEERVFTMVGAMVST